MVTDKTTAIPRKVLTAAIAAILLGIVLAACGGNHDTPRQAEELPPARSTGATFNEVDTAGRTLWILVADEVVQRDNEMHGDSLQLQIFDPLSEDTRAGLATAKTGMLRRVEDKNFIELSDGYVFESTEGWTAKGNSLMWNGRQMTTSEPITIRRGSSQLKGSAAEISPDENRFILQNASGTIENLKL